MSHFGAYTGVPENILMGLADRLGSGGGGGGLGIPSRYENDGGGGTLMMLCPDHARSLAQGGHTKASIRKYFSENGGPGRPLKLILATLNTGYESLPADVRERIESMDPDTLIGGGGRNGDNIHFSVVGGPSASSEIMSCNAISDSKVINI
jgi:hypothetical protein